MSARRTPRTVGELDADLYRARATAPDRETEIRARLDATLAAAADLRYLLAELDNARASVAALHEKVNILFARQLGADC